MHTRVTRTRNTRPRTCSPFVSQRVYQQSTRAIGSLAVQQQAIGLRTHTRARSPSRRLLSDRAERLYVGVKPDKTETFPPAQRRNKNVLSAGS